MIDQMRTVSRRERVSSKEIRDVDDKFHRAISTQYHRVLQLLGKVRTASTCLSATNGAMTRLYRSLSDRVEGSLVVNASSPVLYPSSLVESAQATVEPEFGVITARVLNRALVFTDEKENIRPHINVARSTSGVGTTTRTIVENAVSHALVGTEPYLARFVGSNTGYVELTLDILSLTRKMNINALRLVPMPSAGGVSLVQLVHTNNDNVILNGGLPFPESFLFRESTSLAGHIHFQPIETNLLRMTLATDLYLSDLDCSVIGVAKVIGEYNTYAKNSAVGFSLDIPDGATRLAALSISADNFAQSVENAKVKVYSDLSSFNAMSNDYITWATHTMQTPGVSVSGEKIYLLLEIESVDGTTPCIGKITARFE